MATAAKRRRTRGTAWHWKQTDSWYYTPLGTKQRVPLVDENGQRIRGIENKNRADLALARIKASGQWRPEAEAAASQWLVARVCSEFIQNCQQRAARGDVSCGYRDDVVRCLNAFAEYCGAMAVPQLTKGHVEYWIESHATWRSPATQCAVIAILQAAFNYAQREYDVRNPLRGLKKPPPRPRLHSITAEDETLIYSATDEAYRDFLFAAIHTGLRPFCELARLTARDVEETSRGMMWRVYSSKTKKTRKIPVRAAVAHLTRKILAAQPPGDGVIFRNPQGNPWIKVTGVSRFRAIRRTLGWDSDPQRSRYSTYSCRHTFAHRMLAGYWNGGVGCSIETLAELMGDTPKTTFDHYGREWGQHYQEPLWSAIGLGMNAAGS